MTAAVGGAVWYLVGLRAKPKVEAGSASLRAAQRPRHFGLGDATEADVRVIWPDGVASDGQHVKGDELYLLERDRPAALWAAK